MAHAHHHHSHAADIDAAERERITAFCASQSGKDEAWLKRAEQILGELAFYSMQQRSQTGLWTMGELDRFVTDYLVSHLGDSTASQHAPEVIALFAEWLKASGQVPGCDVGAVQKRMRKIQSR